MDYKKIKASHEAITRDLSEFDKGTGNIYETVVVLGKRANQISSGIPVAESRKSAIFVDRQRNEFIFQPVHDTPS